MDKEYINNNYVAVKPHIMLRILKGTLIAKNMQTNNALILNNEAFSILSLCNGKFTLGEIMETTLAKDKILNLMGTYHELLNFLPFPLKNPRFKNLPILLHKRTKSWPYDSLREETPYRLELSLTGACNHRCSYCFQSCDVKKSIEMGTAQWMDILEQGAAMGVQEVVFTGGEPLLYDGFLSLIKKAISLDLYPIVNTNGALLDDQLLAALQRAGATYIHMSLPAIHNPLFGIITGSEENLEKVRHTIANLKYFGFYVRVKMVLLPENLEEASNVIDYCGKHGIDCVHLAPFIPTDKSRKSIEYMVSSKELTQISHMVKKKQEEYPQMIIVPPDPAIWNWAEKGILVKCSGVKDSLTIVANGDVTFCEALAEDGRFLIGNILETNLDDLWNCEHPDKIFQLNNPHEPCKSCKDFSFCNTGCFMLSKMMYGDPFKPDPRCKYSEISPAWPRKETMNES